MAAWEVLMAALFADLSTLEWIYLALFCCGLIYALFLAIFGMGHGHAFDHGGMGHGADFGHGLDLGHGGDLGHGIDLGHGADFGHGVDLGHGADFGHGVDLGHGGDLGHGMDLGHGGDLGHGIDLGHGGDVGHGADVGHGGDVGHGHAGDVHGGDHAAAVDHGDMSSEGQPVHASPWNPVVIATFVAGMGGFGILGTRLFGLRSLLSLVVAIPAGLVLGGAILFLYVTLISHAGGSSAATWQDIRGAPGRVVTSIPEQGLGEVVYEARGSRFAAPARSVDGRPIPQGASVTVLDVEKTAVIVDVRFTD
jgi:hypothetical protein